MIGEIEAAMAALTERGWSCESGGFVGGKYAPEPYGRATRTCGSRTHVIDVTSDGDEGEVTVTWGTVDLSTVSYLDARRAVEHAGAGLDLLCPAEVAASCWAYGYRTQSAVRAVPVETLASQAELIATLLED